jgi:hypothetical protein
MLYNPTCLVILTTQKFYKTYPVRTDTNLGDLDLSTLSVFVGHHVYIKRIIPWLRVAPFVFTREQYSDAKQDHTCQIAYTTIHGIGLLDTVSAIVCCRRR